MKYGDEMINELFLVFSTFNFLEYMETSQPGVKFPKQQPKWTFGCWTCPEIRDFWFFFGGGKILQDFSHQQLFLLATGFGDDPTLMKQMQKELIRRSLSTLDFGYGLREGMDG